MNILINLIINGIAVYAAASLLPGVKINGLLTPVIVAIVLAFVNTFLRPILILLTLPATLFTLGLFILVINALLVMLVSALTPGFNVDSFWWALAFSLVLSAVNLVIDAVFDGKAVVR